MKRSPVIRYPDRRLRVPTEEVTDIDDPDLALATRRLLSVLETLPNGVALAANQLGLKYRMFAIDRKRADRDDMGITIPTLVGNPKIVRYSDDVIVMEEGCLSFPGMSFSVPRSVEVDVTFSFFGQKGIILEKRTLSGLWAQVFQHEVEHLDGKTLIDFMPENKRVRIATLLTARKAF